MRARLAEQVLLLDLLDHRDRGRRGDRVAAEGAAEAAGLRGVHDLRTAGDARERQAARDALREEHEVGLEAEVLAREPGAGAGHAALDLVRRDDDVVLVRPRLQRRQEPLGRRLEAALALDRLDDEDREVLRADVLLDVGDRARGRLGAGEPVAVRVGGGHVVDVAGERAEAGAVGHRLEVHRHREVRAPVVRVLEHGDRAPPRRLAGDLHAVLDGLGAGVHEHGLLRERARRALGDELRDPHVRLVRRDGEEGVQEVAELGPGGLDDGVVRVADGGHADARAQVEEAVAVDVLDDGAVGAADVDGEHRVDADRHGREAPLMQRLRLRAGDRGDDPAGGQLVGRGGVGDERVGHATSLRIAPRARLDPRRRPRIPEERGCAGTPAPTVPQDGRMPSTTSTHLRRFAPAAVAAALALALAGCSGTPSGGSSASSSAGSSAASSSTASPATNPTACATEGSASKAVQVSGKAGAAPTVKFPLPTSSTATQRTIVTAGSGDTVKAGSSVKIAYTLFEGATGKQLDQSGYTAAKKPVILTADTSQYLPGLVQAIVCGKVGERFAAVIPPSAAFGTQGSEQLGVGANHSLVLVGDILSLTPTKATGAVKTLPSGFPKVTLAVKRAADRDGAEDRARRPR